MAYYDLHVEIGEAEKAAAQARLLGFDSVALVRNEQILSSFEGIEIISSVMLRPKSVEELKRDIEKFRDKAELICVYGGNYEVNRAACEDSRVDILCHPEKERNDSGIDHICAKAAADNKVAIEINFSEIFNARSRPKQLYFLGRNIYLCKKYGTSMVITSGAKSIWEMRAPRELASIAHVLGMELSTAIDSVSSIPENIIKENREKLSGKKVGNVKIIGDQNG